MQLEYRARTKLFRKIFLVTLASIASCVLVTSGVIYLYMKPVIENSLVEKKKNTLRNLSEQEINILEEVATYARNITFDDTIQGFLKAVPGEGSYEYFAGILSMERRLKEYGMVYGSLIRDIFVADRSGKALETVNTYGNIGENEVYEKFFNEGAESGFTAGFEQDYYGVIGKKDTVAYVNPVYDKNGIKKEIGKLVVLLDMDKIDTRLVTDEDIYLKIAASDGGVILDHLTSDGLAGKGHVEEIDIDGWKVTYEIDMKEITDVMGRMSGLVIVIITIILCSVSFLTLSLLGRLIAPLDTLIRGMKHVSDGSRKEHIEIHTGDECEDAANVFNEMVESIDLHTKELLRSEKKQFDLQMKTLSYQLNPHFIYNTLNAIICLARRHKDEEIMELTRALIALLQLLLRTDLQAMTTVEKEKEYINNYVNVLQICYRNVPDITWEIQEGLNTQKLPRMILYPLVENSVFHGIVPNEKKGVIRIIIEEQAGRIYVTVSDNGVGCTEEQLHKIRSWIDSEKVEDHVGLLNVSQRIRLIYQESHPLTITGREGEGMTISFSFEKAEKV